MAVMRDSSRRRVVRLRQRGQSMTEVAIILVAVAVLSILILGALGSKAQSQFSNVCHALQADAVSNLNQGTTPPGPGSGGPQQEDTHSDCRR